MRHRSSRPRICGDEVFLTYLDERLADFIQCRESVTGTFSVAMSAGVGMRYSPFPNENELGSRWEELGVGAPTLMALAMLCGKALAGEAASGELSLEARAILHAARQRGLVEIKGANTAFESPERLLAVHVELEPERGIAFRSRANPEFTVRCLDGFRQLCAAGLVMHHLYREFSLTMRGFETARSVPAELVQEILDQTMDYG